MTLVHLLNRFRWPLTLVGGVAVGVASGMAMGGNTVAGMDQFYANVAAADAERLSRIQSSPDDVPTDPMLIDNTLPPVAPVDLSFSRAANAAVGDDAAGSGE